MSSAFKETQQQISVNFTDNRQFLKLQTENYNKIWWWFQDLGWKEVHFKMNFANDRKIETQQQQQQQQQQISLWLKVKASLNTQQLIVLKGVLRTENLNQLPW